MDADARLITAARRAFADALTLVFPVDCAGCDEPDVALCDACRLGLTPAVVHRRLDGGLLVWSGLSFAGVPARVIRGLKEDGRTGLARPLAPALGAAVAAATAPATASEVLLVPVPTSRAAFRRRGFRVPELVARRAGLSTARLLVPTRRTADQRGLDRDGRRANVAGALAARCPATDAASRSVVIVDDVVTTGATLEEAARALRAAGYEVLGAATIAATRRTGGWASSQSKVTGDIPRARGYGGSDKATDGPPLAGGPEQGGQGWNRASSAWESVSPIASGP